MKEIRANTDERNENRYRDKNAEGSIKPKIIKRIF